MSHWLKKIVLFLVKPILKDELEWKQRYQDLLDHYNRTNCRIESPRSFRSPISEYINTGHYYNSLVKQEKLVADLYFNSHFVFDKPKEILGGDCTVFIEIGDILLFGVLDCVGHGLDGLISSLYYRRMIAMELMKMENEISLEALVNKIDSKVRALQQDRLGLRTEFDCALCLYQKGDDHLSFVGAYLPLIHISNGQLTEYADTRKAIGLLGREMKFEQQTIPITKNDSIYLTTDGYHDQFGGLNGRKYRHKYKDQAGYDPTVRRNSFNELLVEISHLSMDDQLLKLEQEFEDWREKDKGQLDDVLILGIRC